MLNCPIRRHTSPSPETHRSFNPAQEERPIHDPGDVNTLARYCHILARRRTAEEFIDGSVYPPKDPQCNTRYLQQFPQVSFANKLAQQLTRLEAEFGMTPSARSRIHIDPRKIPGEQSEESLRKSRHFSDFRS